MKKRVFFCVLVVLLAATYYFVLQPKEEIIAEETLVSPPIAEETPVPEPEEEEIPFLEIETALDLAARKGILLSGIVVMNDGETITIRAWIGRDVFVKISTQGMVVDKGYILPEGERAAPGEEEATWTILDGDNKEKTYYIRMERITPAEIKVGDEVLFSFPAGHSPMAHVVAEDMPRGK